MIRPVHRATRQDRYENLAIRAGHRDRREIRPAHPENLPTLSDRLVRRVGHLARRENHLNSLAFSDVFVLS